MHALRWLRWRFDTHMHSKALRGFFSWRHRHAQQGDHHIRFDQYDFLMRNDKTGYDFQDNFENIFEEQAVDFFLINQ